MSVITKAEGSKNNHYKVFCKGAPEKIATLCIKNTIPRNFKETLN
jgi:magnesium-transporting ATPase (P-type)